VCGPRRGRARGRRRRRWATRRGMDASIGQHGGSTVTYEDSGEEGERGQEARERGSTAYSLARRTG
jgi:hypothetical protein